MEVPIFKGEDDENLDGWLHRVKCYFVMNRLTEKDKLDVVVLCLEGEALDWYQWENNWSTIGNWSQFQELFLKRFQPSNKANRYAKLMKLQQDSSMRDYQQHFEHFSVGLKEFGAKGPGSKFVCGLKEEIQSEMRKLKPVGLKAMMTMAQLIEDDHKIQQKMNKTGGNSPRSKSTLTASRSSSNESRSSGVGGLGARSFTFQV